MNRLCHILLGIMCVVLTFSCAEEKVKTYTYECMLSDVETIEPEKLPALEEALMAGGVMLGEPSIQKFEGKGYYESTRMADADQKAVVKYFEWNSMISGLVLPYEPGQSFNYTMYRLNETASGDIRRVKVMTEQYVNNGNIQSDYRYTCEISDVVALSEDTLALVREALAVQGALLDDASIQEFTAISTSEDQAAKLADELALTSYQEWASKIVLEDLPIQGGSFNYSLYRQKLPLDGGYEKVQVKATPFARNYSGEYLFTCELTETDALSESTLTALREALKGQGVMLDSESEQTISAEAPTEPDAAVKANAEAAVKYDEWRGLIIMDELPLAEGESFNYTLFRVRLPEGENPEKVQVQSNKYTKENGNENTK